MTTPSAERYLSATLLNKSPRERLCDVDAMVDAITDHAIIQLDVDGNVVRWCPGAEALLGYSATEVLDRPMSMFHIEEQRAGGLAERELAAARESGRYEFEGWRVRKCGELFRARVVLSPIHDETGAVTGFALVIRDVTAEHRRTETMFHDLLEAAPDAMIIAAADGRILLANAQTDEMFGYRREDLIGMEVDMLIPPRLRETHGRHRAKFFASPKVRRMGVGLELRGLRRDGTEFPIEVSLSPLRTDRGVLVSAAMRDITDRAAIQSDLADAYAEAEVFAERDRIGSELQDHAIQRVFAVGLALQATIPRARSAEVRERLVAAVDDLHGVVQDFRTAIFGLRTRSADVTRVRRRLDELIGEVAGGLATTVQYKGPLSVLGVELAEHAEAVVGEAISNAVRHAEAAKLTVVIDVADMLCIEVVDDGKGMCGNVTGSGLVDLRQRAEAVGGTLTVADGPHGGTRLRWAAPLP
ncbi:PAS domain S-box protein [Mycobacterium sp.]|uniref:PAS domain-containing sensor histidine kinase n=1 Tax=Mycobacterium sp. TaxID=1785 RepID=UPI002BC59A17|nr:PAS domain S-box protein [Mycobacterium sp.]HTY32899.1 PAS domain S-box protein [Mycobacterium sp.]